MATIFGVVAHTLVQIEIHMIIGPCETEVPRSFVQNLAASEYDVGRARDPGCYLLNNHAIKVLSKIEHCLGYCLCRSRI